jgi:membrane fusion protein (multidrug efflux system)
MIRQSIKINIFLAVILTIGCRGIQNDQNKKNETPRGSQPAALPTITTTTIESKEIDRQLHLPGELKAWQEVDLTAKVAGYVENLTVDRGTTVRAGQVLARLGAPEIKAQLSGREADSAALGFRRIEAEAHARSTHAQRLEAEARLAAATATWRRLKGAAATPGVVSGNELETAQRQVEAETARVQVFRENELAAQAQVGSLNESEKAARASTSAAKATTDYLRLSAPFSGIITERFAHPGNLASPGQPLLRLQQISRLRLIVNLPEAEVASLQTGRTVSFTLPAFPGQTFQATVARVASALDPRTRTMPIELDVLNQDLKLAPGMFPQVSWPATRRTPSLLVPPAAVAVTTERTFIIRINDGLTEWVDVKRGVTVNLALKEGQEKRDYVEVFGNLTAGETIAARGTDELRNGTRVTPATK